ncbi:hypothetical protein [Pseudomonas koreensis]|uniref:hypothetical protein n=1 Tax=Pseudomonas koreensis TaxID=198620 RepID=UPI001B32D738|nr:hypothetical protein [Pseudomonas koreensis]MBP4001372.1 hypothetical protein [Pseudomonas koreensis]
MDVESLILQIQENINYQEGKLAYLWGAKEKTNFTFLEQAANNILDPQNAAVNQALTDSLLNAMASLVDYYCMYCFLKMGVKEEQITKVQYRPMNNQALLAASSNKLTSLDLIRESFDRNITEISKRKLADISTNDYWPAIFGDAATSVLFKVGVVPGKKFELAHGVDGFEINSKVRKFHYYMHRLYCNQFLSGGVKYNLFIDINNCLKHNIVPYVTPKLESFAHEERAFSYIEFKNDNTVFLKPSLLKTLVDYDFDAMREGLEQVRASNTNLRSELEIAWGMDDILRVDKENGYLSQDEKTLYFFIDNILMAKTREATFVDVGISLKRALGRLMEDIRWGMGLDMSEFDQ